MPASLGSKVLQDLASTPQQPSAPDLSQFCSTLRDRDSDMQQLNMLWTNESSSRNEKRQHKSDTREGVATARTPARKIRSRATTARTTSARATRISRPTKKTTTKRHSSTTTIGTTTSAPHENAFTSTTTAITRSELARDQSYSDSKQHHNDPELALAHAVRPLGHHYDCDYDYDDLWKRIREEKPCSQSRRQIFKMSHRDAESLTTESTATTTKQPEKGDKTKYAEQMLHPRWIAIQDAKTSSQLENFQAQLLEGLARRRFNFEGGQTALTEDISRVIGPLEVQLEVADKTDNSDSHKIKRQVEYLESVAALESQWQVKLWQRYFLKDCDGTPQDLDLVSCAYQIPQARMLFDGDCTLPPLLATTEHRRKSRRKVSGTPWDPDLTKAKDGVVLWYPDYAYSLALDNLTLESINSLPGIRHAPRECAPSYLLVEVKRSIDYEPAAKHYMAFLGAYTIHERLLLRLAASNKRTATDHPIHLDPSLSVYILTCCGKVCKVWKMHIREISRADRGRGQEPIRYDLKFLDVMDVSSIRQQDKLKRWINYIHYYGSTTHFEALKSDAAAAKKLQGLDAVDWMGNLAFIYDNDAGNTVRAVRCSDLQKAYGRGDLTPERAVSRNVVEFVGEEFELVESGQKFDVSLNTVNNLFPGADVTI